MNPFYVGKQIGPPLHEKCLWLLKALVLYEAFQWELRNFNILFCRTWIIFIVFFACMPMAYWMCQYMYVKYRSIITKKVFSPFLSIAMTFAIFMSSETTPVLYDRYCIDVKCGQTAGHRPNGMRGKNESFGTPRYIYHVNVPYIGCLQS